MITVNEPTISQQLRKMAVDLDADFFEDYGASKLVLNNHNGEGYINSYDISPYLSVRTYNVKFKKEIRLIKNESRFSPVYFLYNIKGYFYHKFHDDEDLQKIGQMQNVVLVGDKTQQHIVVFPADVELKMSVLFLLSPDDDSEEANNPYNQFFSKTVNDSIEYIKRNVKSRYFGEIDTGIRHLAE